MSKRKRLVERSKTRLRRIGQGIVHMSGWERVVASFATDVEDQFDSLKRRFFSRLGEVGSPCVIPYYGFGTPERVHLRGRLLEDNRVTQADDNDTVWRNLLNMYRRFDSRELPGAQVRVRVNSTERELLTNDEGYFSIELPLVEPLSPTRAWHDVEVELLGTPHIRGVGKVLIPPSDAEYGVISDIDDTVIKTDVIDLIKMARNTFLHNARTRLPFEGVAGFYQALQRGTRGNFNPIFYVSSSPWNLYDLLVDFFEVRGIPAGPLFLTDLGLSRTQIVKPGRVQHKLGNIQRLLDTYPKLPFILIGDSGEKDPEIYLKVVQANPGRIRAIYIRDVTDEVRDRQMQAIVQEARTFGTEMLFVKDTVAAADHALQRGFILPETIPTVQAERAEDKKSPSELENLLDPGTLGTQ